MEASGGSPPATVERSVISWRLDWGEGDGFDPSALALLAEHAGGSSVAIVSSPLDRLPTTDTASAYAAALDAAGLAPMFCGFAPPDRPGRRPSRLVAVLGPTWCSPPGPAPPSFRVLAIITAFNEADLIRSTVTRLIDDGIDVHLLDNWSTDGTVDAVADLVGHGLVGVDRYPPEGDAGRFDLHDAMRRVAAVAEGSGADWIVHHDADERRDGPWAGVGLRDSLYAVHRWGFNAIDHTVIEFQPVDDGFVPGTDPGEHMRHFEFTQAGKPDRHYVKAWRNRQPVDLASSAGHDVSFPGRRVFPFHFLLRHYPIRSQAHGERKVYRERLARYRQDEVEIGWHNHYAKVREGRRFLRDPAGLVEFDDTFAERFLVERLTGVGIRLPGGPGPLKATALRLARWSRLLPVYVAARRRFLVRRWQA